MTNQAKPLTFEDVDKLIQATDLKQFQPGGAQHARTLTDPMAKICPIYLVVKPILSLVMAFPFFPAKWREAVSIFTSVLDMSCPIPPK